MTHGASTPADDALHEQLSAWLDGELSADESAAAQERLRDDPQALAILEDLRRVRGALRALPRAMPPAQLVTRALQASGGVARQPRRANLPVLRGLAVLGGAAAMLMLGVWVGRESVVQSALELRNEADASPPSPAQRQADREAVARGPIAPPGNGGAPSATVSEHARDQADQTFFEMADRVATAADSDIVAAGWVREATVAQLGVAARSIQTVAPPSIDDTLQVFVTTTQPEAHAQVLALLQEAPCVRRGASTASFGAVVEEAADQFELSAAEAEQLLDALETAAPGGVVVGLPWRRAETALAEMMGKPAARDEGLRADATLGEPPGAVHEPGSASQPDTPVAVAPAPSLGAGGGGALASRPASVGGRGLALGEGPAEGVLGRLWRQTPLRMRILVATSADVAGSSASQPASAPAFGPR